MQHLTPMAGHIVWAMEGKGKMTTQSIYRAVKNICEKQNRELPENWDAVVRQTLQAHCSSRPQYKGGDDLFVYHKRGYWSCSATSPTIHDL